jgi:hypothetical protein
VISEAYEDVDPYTADHRDYLLIQTRVNLMAVSQMSDLKANKCRPFRPSCCSSP